MNLKEFCGGEDFFNPTTVFNSSDPEFSGCFEDIVFDLLPVAYILFFGLAYFFAFRNSYTTTIPVSRLFVAKLIFTVLLWILAWADFGRGLWEWLNNVDISYAALISPLIIGLGMVTAAFFTNFDRLKGIRSSGLLTLYWILYIITWALVFKTKVELIMRGDLSVSELWRCVTFFLSYTCVIALLIMSFMVDQPSAQPPQDPYYDASEDLLQQTDKDLKVCPENAASFLSKMMFEWFSKMIFLGYKRPLVDEDLWLLNNEDKCSRVSRHFMKNWNVEKAKVKKAIAPAIPAGNSYFAGTDEEVLIEQPEEKKKMPSLFKALVVTFGPYFAFSAFLKLINDVLTFVSPQLLSALIAYTTNNAPVWQGYLLAVLLFVTAIVQSIVLQQYFHVCFVAGMRLRSAVVASVYKKALILSNAAKKESTVGEVVNLMSVDAQRFMDLMSYINIIWSGPFQIILAMYFLWLQLGPSVLAGLCVMIILIPINGLIASKAHKLQVRQMKHKDERIKLMNEVLNGIKVLKMYAWEMSFKEKLTSIRNLELGVLRSAAYLNAGASFTWVCAPFMVSLISFAVYVISDPHNVLDAQKAFVSISLFNILRFPLMMLPVMVSALVQSNVSLKRLQKFLSNEELDERSVNRNPHSSSPAIEVIEGTFSWAKDEDPVLRDISLDIPDGKLVAVVGQVGSGKSSLISSLLGDMEKIEGHVSVKGSVAYVAQQAWIQNLTVRDNILFGQKLDVCKYQDTVEACELKEDFDMLPGGDQTEIGERGINLSGGQKQRVSIARAVYQDAQVYLFDDPLSAVDSHVGKNIFDNVLGPRGVLRKKTRILVTHGVNFLPQVDSIVVLVNGRITEVGDYYQLLEKNGAFAEFLRNYADADDETFEEEDPTVPISPVLLEDDEAETDPMIEAVDSSTQAKRKFERQRSRKSMSESAVVGPTCKYVPLKKNDPNRVCKLPQQKQQDDKLITTETAETGNVGLSVLTSYMRSLGYHVVFIIVLLYTIQNGLSVYSNIWLSQWSNDPINPDGTQNSTSLRLGVYAGVGFGQALTVLFASFALSFGSVAAARVLHANMLHSIMRAPMAFFDTTPLGRVMNRFSKDVYLVDEVIPRCLSTFLSTMFLTLATFFVIIFSTPIFAVVVIPILILYWFVQRFYVRTSRQLKRLESISRSPIYSHFSETMNGTSTIRAYGLKKNFVKQNEAKVDTNQMAYYPNIVSNRWLALRLEIVGNLIVLFAAIFAVLEKGKIESGIVGLSISYAMQITMIMNWMVRMASEVETNIVAVERVKEYTNVDQEAPLKIANRTPPGDWPDIGGIHFDDYSTRYREDLDLVVKNIDVNIGGGEKVGLVGRTGAGKSSMTLALFRIIESASGRIVIDGRNIADMGLGDLRSKLSIIPQDPVLFSGTMRMNLDPFEAYDDDKLWDALEHSHLKEFVTSLPDKLEHQVAEGGENLSVGQRQLVCLARALLRRSKILVLDEATAAVDLETDDLIQKTIRDRFADCTTFTIAHRLNTIMDSTRVIVLDAGKVVEFDSPENLLKAKGIFYSMAKDAGLT
uniref:Multidrug resistance-associated protein 1-like n=1 Tax=Phallusia mammillata TaxID=59560 RepID=A0A6F9D4X8_9ASCI|nr:multidrug resistance-associated protein 1-like [Phallusia mammillata]